MNGERDLFEFLVKTYTYKGELNIFRMQEFFLEKIRKNEIREIDLHYLEEINHIINLKMKL